jgi:hypothetical protein
MYQEVEETWAYLYVCMLYWLFKIILRENSFLAKDLLCGFYQMIKYIFFKGCGWFIDFVDSLRLKNVIC